MNTYKTNAFKQARDTKGHILSQKEHITKGKFSFTSEVYDTYEICFISKVPPRKYYSTTPQTHMYVCA